VIINRNLQNRYNFYASVRNHKVRVTGAGYWGPSLPSTAASAVLLYTAKLKALKTLKDTNSSPWTLLGDLIVLPRLH